MSTSHEDKDKAKPEAAKPVQPTVVVMEQPREAEPTRGLSTIRKGGEFLHNGKRMDAYMQEIKDKD